VADGWTRSKSGLWQPDPERKKLKLSAGGARFAYWAFTQVKQTKGRWGSGFDIYGNQMLGGPYGSPLALESWQLQVASEGLKTKPSGWLDVDLTLDPHELYRRIGEWVKSEKFGRVGGPRVYREWYLQMPKKVGKSTISSALGIYFTGFDGEPGAEVYALASSKGQARTVFEQARQMIFKSPFLMDEFNVYKDVIEHEASGSIFRVLAADADYNEGFNPHAVIIDELHVHKDRELYDAMTSHLHTGAREDPIAITITNAGDDEDSICYELYSQAKAVIEGRPDARKDLYAYVPELEPSEIYDKSKWHKVMPSSWQNQELMEEARKKHPEYVFLRRYLNVWTDAQEGWLPYEFWEAGEVDGPRASFFDGEWEGPDEAEVFELGKGLSVVPVGLPPDGVPIVIGGDLGKTKDTTALAWAGVDSLCECDAGAEEFDIDEHDEDCPFGIIYVGTHIWGVRQRDKAHNPPCHTLVNGDRFPMKELRYYIVDQLRPNYEILEFAYDPWGMEPLAQELMDEGLNCVEFAQTDTRMVPASEDLWNVIARDNLLRHAADPILTKHVMAGVVDETGRGWRINKRKTKKPCDGLIAMLMAVHRALHYHRVGTPSVTVL
jgi:phage terminase large subunit-like protein